MAQQVILSIQSAVMHGAVGNDAAMPVYPASEATG